MAWDPTKPATNADLLSPEVRANWAALDALLVAPVTALADGQVLTKAAGPVVAGVPAGTNGFVLTLVGGVPLWQAGFANPMTTAGDLILGGASGAPTRLGKGADATVLTVVSGTPAWAAGGGGGTKAPLPLPLEQATLPDGTGTGNNPPELVREVSSTSQTPNTPKRTRTFAKFDAATDEHLMWGRSLPGDYVSGGTLRCKVKAATATTGNMMWKAGIVVVTDGVTNDTAAVFTAADLSAAVPCPGTLGQTVEFTLALTMTGAAANREFTVFIGRDADHASDTMAGDAVLMSARLEYA